MAAKSGRTNEVAWAVVTKDSGKLCTTQYRGQKAIWTCEADAKKDCPAYAEVVRVRITEVRPK